MDILAAARACSAEPGCAAFGAPDGLVMDPDTDQPLLSVHVKGAMDVGPLLDWADARPQVQVDSKLVHVFGMTGHEVDISMDLLDGDAWTGLRAALEPIADGAFVSVHPVPALADGVHPDLAAAQGEILACAGDTECLQALWQAWPWLDAELGIGAVHLDVPHDGSQHDAIASELETLGWVEPPWVFAIDHADGAHRTRAVGRLPSTQLDTLQAWLDGQSWSASSRPLTEDELSMVRLRLSVAEAAADLLACAGDAACHYDAGQTHQALVSPAGRLGVYFLGEDPDIDGLNGLEYPGWSMAPAGYFMDGAAGLLTYEALRDVGLGHWHLGEALSLEVDHNPEALALSMQQWEAAWGPDDEPASWPFLPDVDGDGVPDVSDCEPLDPSVFPGAPELCDGKDNDCDGWLPSEELQDGDGDSSVACEDCDDGDATVFPGAPPLCDGLDNDCDPFTPEVFDTDSDGDGVRGCQGDCDDGEASVYPGAPELCDGLDNDCDLIPEAGAYDFDGDGYLACEDCDDYEPQVNPGMPELCDGVDTDCDGQLLTGPLWTETMDQDGDGVLVCNDCDDQDPTASPGKPELCDGVDNDCDGIVPPDEIDDDGDGQAECEGDCADWDPNVFDTGGDMDPEVCDGVDNDCNGYVDHYFSFTNGSNSADFSEAVVFAQGTADILLDGYTELIAENEVLWPPPDDTNPRARSGALIFRDNAHLGRAPATSPFCATFDFRIIPPPPSDSGDYPGPGGTFPSDGFAFVMFDGTDTDGFVSEDDWITDGGYGGGHLGTFDYDGTAGDTPGWAIEFDLFTNVNLGDPPNHENHVALSALGPASGDSLIPLHRFFPDFIGDVSGAYDLLAPPDAGPDEGWFQAMIGWADPYGFGATDDLLVAVSHQGDGATACEYVPDVVGHNGLLYLGFTVGAAASGYETVEIADFSVVCAPCFPAPVAGCDFVP